MYATKSYQCLKDIGHTMSDYLKRPLLDSVYNSVSMSEERLYLNHYRPKHTQPGSKIPVMIYINSDSFILFDFGSVSLYSGT